MMARAKALHAFHYKFHFVEDQEQLVCYAIFGYAMFLKLQGIQFYGSSKDELHLKGKFSPKAFGT